ncbi:MAG: adenosylmethionine decarboxylase [Desulfurococcaceae archaeon]
MNPESKHILIDAWGTPYPKVLDDVNFIENLLTLIAIATKSTIMKKISHKFEPQGVSSVVLVAESHISAHTYPEENYIAIDIFTCGKTEPENGIPIVEEVLRPIRIEVTEVVRGRRDGHSFSRIKRR